MIEIKNHNPDDFDWDLHESGKYNTSVKLTEEDIKAGVKIYCKEPYAQELYDAMVAAEAGNTSEAPNKDISIGMVCKVTAKVINFTDQMIYTEEESTMMPISVPFKEFSNELDELSKGEGMTFNVCVFKDSGHGELYGSERMCKAESYKEELFELYESNKWFEVKIVSLIKGGYLALFRDEVECFIPGSHAGANVVHDFKKKLGQTINVMVDNYDASNDLFILSYKKYVKYSMPERINELEFGKVYSGVSTNKPYDFGVFVEIDDYYTGLIHSSEFEDYSKVKSTLKRGEQLDVYVKDISIKNVKNGDKSYRIVLTLNEKDINPAKKKWQDIKLEAEGKLFNFSYNDGDPHITVNINDEDINIGIKRSMQGKINYSSYNHVLIEKVDHINQNFRFEFTK